MRTIMMLLLILAAYMALAGVPASAPATPQIAVELTLTAVRHDGVQAHLPEATLLIQNLGKTDLTLPHPGNRMALAFLVMDESGIPVQPRGIAKVDPAYQTLQIKAGETSVQKVGAFKFLTASGLFDYELQAGHTYRVIAVYRPEGEKSAGICTREVLFKFE